MEEIKNEEFKKEESMNFEKIAEENLIKFKDAMDSQNKEKMLALFAKEFHFLPTKWNKIVTQLRGNDFSAEKYFDHFFESKPVIMITDSFIIDNNEKSYDISGLDDFELTNKETGERQIVHCKFDQKWISENGEWKMKKFLSAIAIDGY